MGRVRRAGGITKQGKTAALCKANQKQRSCRHMTGRAPPMNRRRVHKKCHKLGRHSNAPPLKCLHIRNANGLDHTPYVGECRYHTYRGTICIALHTVEGSTRLKNQPLNYGRARESQHVEEMSSVYQRCVARTVAREHTGARRDKISKGLTPFRTVATQLAQQRPRALA